MICYVHDMAAFMEEPKEFMDGLLKDKGSVQELVLLYIGIDVFTK